MRNIHCSLKCCSIDSWVVTAPCAVIDAVSRLSTYAIARRPAPLTAPAKVQEVANPGRSRAKANLEASKTASLKAEMEKLALEPKFQTTGKPGNWNRKWQDKLGAPP